MTKTNFLLRFSALCLLGSLVAVGCAPVSLDSPAPDLADPRRRHLTVDLEGPGALLTTETGVLYVTPDGTTVRELDLPPSSDDEELTLLVRTDGQVLLLHETRDYVELWQRALDAVWTQVHRDDAGTASITSLGSVTYLETRGMLRREERGGFVAIPATVDGEEIWIRSVVGDETLGALFVEYSSRSSGGRAYSLDEGASWTPYETEEPFFYEQRCGARVCFGSGFPDPYTTFDPATGTFTPTDIHLERAVLPVAQELDGSGVHPHIETRVLDRPWRIDDIANQRAYFLNLSAGGCFSLPTGPGGCESEVSYSVYSGAFGGGVRQTGSVPFDAGPGLVVVDGVAWSIGREQMIRIN